MRDVLQDRLERVTIGLQNWAFFYYQPGELAEHRRSIENDGYMNACNGLAWLIDAARHPYSVIVRVEELRANTNVFVDQVVRLDDRGQALELLSVKLKKDDTLLLDHYGTQLPPHDEAYPSFGREGVAYIQAQELANLLFKGAVTLELREVNLC